MQNLKFYILIITSLILMSASCKKDKPQQSVSELSKLPPATQIGANKIGCLVNGQVFLPNYIDPYDGTGIQCDYMYINKGFYLTVRCSHLNSDGSISSVVIYTDSLAAPILQGDTISLTSFNVHGKSCGAYYSINPPYNSKNYYTNESVTGQLIITRLDQPNFIISGTFSFKGVDENGDIVEVTDGRFDMIYTD